MSKFSSEGFDLDACGDVSSDVVFEIGGGATVVTNKDDKATTPPSPESPPSPLQQADAWKQRGNEEFKKKNYLEAYDLYTEAIEACPCEMKIDDILRLREDFEANERDNARIRIEKETCRRRRGDETNDGEKEEEKKSLSSQSEESEDISVFKLPPQEHGDQLAIFLNNRAASLIQLKRFDEAIKDADIALLLNPKYTKAYVRRSSAYEKTERTEEALRDMKRALELDPSNATVRKAIVRLQRLEDERLEKLKTETMDKLKDLGNSLLGNFGLSLDNFNAVQDPNTGSYSISFNQNK